MSRGAKSSYKRVKRREFCLDCGLTEAEAGSPISVQGYCLDCGLRRAREANLAMKNKSGPLWEKWLRSQKAYLESQKKGG